MHHGNGTQAIFYDRPDMFTVSLHVDPSAFYPFFWGHASERGRDAGLGANLNMPLPQGTGDDVYLNTLDAALTAIKSFAPGALVVALGLDASVHDPLMGMALSGESFGRIGSEIARLHVPTLFVQEGGYLSDALGPNLAATLCGFEQARGIR